MSGRVIWREIAVADLTAAYLYIGADSPKNAERLLVAVEHAVSLLMENPRAGSPTRFRSTRARGVRFWPVRGFDLYLLFYRADGADIDVLRILHGARDVPREFERGS